MKILLHQEKKKEKEREPETPITCPQEREYEAEQDSSFSTLETRDNIRENAFQRCVPPLLFFTVASTKIRLVRWHRENTNYNFPSFSIRGVDLMKIPRRVNNVSPPGPNELSN